MKLVLLYFAGAVCLTCITVWLHTRHHMRKKNLSQLITGSEQVNCMQEKSFQPIRISFELYKTQILNRVRQAKTWNSNFRWLTVHLDYWLVSTWGSRSISRYVVGLWGRGQNQNKATTQSSLQISSFNKSKTAFLQVQSIHGLLSLITVYKLWKHYVLLN